MVDAVTLAQLKAHLRVEAEDTDEDDQIDGLRSAALRTIENRTGRRFDGDVDTIEAADLPAARQAALLLAGHWYRNRETVVTGTIAADLPMAVEYLIQPFTKLAV